MIEATITRITGAGTWDGPHGLLYKFEYTFDDGVTLTAQHKTEAPPFKVGDKVNYEIKQTNQYGNMGKVSRLEAQPFKAPDRSKGGSNLQARSFALSYAKDVYIGIYGAKDPAEVAQEINDLAEIFLEFLLID